VCLAAPGYVPVNADNTNNSAVTNGIPAQRDFNVAPMVDAQTHQLVNDTDLLAATLTADRTLPAGTWSTTITYTPPGAQIALWTNQMKTANFSPNGLGTMRFYIEGVHESTRLNDVTLTFQYTVGTPPNQTIYSASAKITVTPLINSFTVTGAAGQNINFVDQNPVDGLKGLAAEILPNTPGATFNAGVTRTNLNGKEVFIQNIYAVTNAPHGGAAGWVFTKASGLASENDVPINGTAFPYLDSRQAVSPEYNLNFNYTTNTADTQVATDNDSPATDSVAMNSDKTEVIDEVIGLQLYLLWKYPSGVYYPIANILWDVWFYANTNVPNKGVSNILITNGVSAGAFGADNTVPEKMAPPFFNGNVDWR
jgi:hypothetical protein